MDRWLQTGSLRRPASVQHDSTRTNQVESQETASTSKEDTICEDPVSQFQAGKRYAEQKNEKVSKRRKYDESYLQFGFTWTGEIENPQPQCILCGEVLTNNSLKPSLLRRHLELKHKECQEKSMEYFKRKLEELKGSKKLLQLNSGVANKDALRASYMVSYRVAQAGKPHTIAKELILPAAKDMVNCMIGGTADKKLDLIPLSNNTVSRRISDMACNVRTQLIERIKKSEFYSLQLDESTDVANLANLLAYVRYIYEESIHEEFLFCRPLPTRSTGEEMYGLTDNFMTEYGVEWPNCAGLSTDGCRAMMGKNSGMVTRIQSKATEAKWIHCSIHREALAAKKMPPALNMVLTNAVKVVNFIKGRPLNSRLFASLCNEMGSNHDVLLLHTEVRWLSRGKVLTRLFELRSEVQTFLQEHPHELSSCFANNIWLQQLAYLSDIFSSLNELNLGLQGLSTTIFNVQDKVEAMIKKLLFWSRCVDENTLGCFSTLQEFLTERKVELDEVVKADIIEHLQQLGQQLRKYFPEMDPSHAWIRNPFEAVLPIPHLSLREQESLIELSSDGGLKSEFSHKPLADFWIQRMTEYPELSRQAVKFLMPFCTTYLCETGFSALTQIKTKHRVKLNVENDLLLKLSSIVPEFSKMCKEKEAQPSH